LHFVRRRQRPCALSSRQTKNRQKIGGFVSGLERGSLSPRVLFVCAKVATDRGGRYTCAGVLCSSARELLHFMERRADLSFDSIPVGKLVPPFPGIACITARKSAVIYRISS